MQMIRPSARIKALLDKMREEAPDMPGMFAFRMADDTIDGGYDDPHKDTQPDWLKDEKWQAIGKPFNR